MNKWKTRDINTRLFTSVRTDLIILHSSASLQSEIGITAVKSERSQSALRLVLILKDGRSTEGPPFLLALPPLLRLVLPYLFLPPLFSYQPPSFQPPFFQ
mmetsp:Transcript_24218/g.43389  ORF Transcript_24218/g.43389 Transcript_24218/m.43389 type:complete len:100 (-) Transcript_24218:1164-1463(-)